MAKRAALDEQALRELARRCPRCRAKPGEPCTSPRGLFYVPPHRQRRQATQKAEANAAAVRRILGKVK